MSEEAIPDPLPPLTGTRGPNGEIIVRHEAYNVYPPLPWWWGKNETVPPGAINYGDIQFPISGAIAPDKYLPVCYGQVRVGGIPIKFGSVTGSEMNHGWGVIPWCEGDIQSIDNIYIDGQLRVAYSGGPWSDTLRLDHYTGNGTQYCQDNSGDIFCPSPRTNPGVGSLGPYDVRGLKTAAYTRVDALTTWQGRMWWWILVGPEGGSGPYEWAADVHGLKIYDPRDGGQDPNDSTTWLYSENPALIARDLLIRSGARTSAQLDDASFIAAADACDSIGFTCNVVFASRTDILDALAVVLQTCNGVIVTSSGKTGLFLDIENAGAAAATLSEADGDIWNLNYEWLSTRDRVTSVAVQFKNRDAQYVSDVTPPVVDPGVALGTVPLKAVSFDAPGINTLAAATVLARYTLNAQAITFRIMGTMSAKGINLAQGNKITITTLKGVSADFVITQIVGDQQGFFNFVAKPYSSAVYSTKVVTQNPPVTNLPGVTDAPPPPAAARVSLLDTGIVFDAPRVYTASGPYGTGSWTIGGAGSGTASKINDGDTTTSAASTGSSLEFKLDAGSAKQFGRLDIWLNMDLAVLLEYGVFQVYYSDDNATWYDAMAYTTGVVLTPVVTPWQDAPVGGIYPTHVEFCDAIGAHRYWWIYLSQVGGTLHVYEAQFSTFTAYTGAIVGYAMIPWPGYVYNGASPQDMMNYVAPNPSLGKMAITDTLPTDADAWAVNLPSIQTVTGNIYTSQTVATRFAVITIGASQESLTANPGSQVVTVAASYTAPSLNGINLGAVTLYAGTNVTITPGSPTANDITIAASGGGGTMTKLRNGSGITGTINDSNTSFTTSANVSAATGGYFVVVDGIIDLAATWVGTTLTPSSAPHSGIAVIYWS